MPMHAGKNFAKHIINMDDFQHAGKYERKKKESFNRKACNF
jgi:hypothetical protein